MSAWHQFADCIRLHVPGRIAECDARRQESTAREILARLARQPGLVLADEVGMGKTFVALAVATSVALSDPERRPTVVMVPPTLKHKWPQDFQVFLERCLPEDVGRRLRAKSAETAVEFLRLLDDAPERRSSIIFLTHGAMHRGLSDRWVKLAIIQRALKGRHGIGPLRNAVVRCLAKLLRLGWAVRREEIWNKLLSNPPSKWLQILHRHGIGPHGDADPDSDDDPVPQSVVDALRDFDTSQVFEALEQIPRRQSANWEARVIEARQILSSQIKEVWRECVSRLRFHLPLLVMDEAHHLKNEATQLASLFHVADAQGDADEIARGALGGVFERMLFLTATPFQLGHHELVSVLERFQGAAWDSSVAPTMTLAEFRERTVELRQKLDAAQHAAVNLDAMWGQLRNEDLVSHENPTGDMELWWQEINAAAVQSTQIEHVLASYRQTFERMRTAEQALQPWVIRHLKPREFEGRLRRNRMAGAAIEHDQPSTSEIGLAVTGSALLPFLLAARATVCNLESRPVFAEGLASSYEAFLHTRQARVVATDRDDDNVSNAVDGSDRAASWYLKKLEQALPRDRDDASASHPKIAATANRAIRAWTHGEKVVVFCHYIATGKVLRQVISSLMTAEIMRLGAAKIGCEPQDVAVNLQRLGDRFFDADSPARKACDAAVSSMLAAYPQLAKHQKTLQEVIRRYLRTPSFLVRYFDIERDQVDESVIEKAFAARDGSGLSLRRIVDDFFEFLESRCVESEREAYLAAVHSIQTGQISGKDATGGFAEDELQGAAPERILPNVRLVNGATRQETRQRLMLTFNSPFFPEILIASSVMSEGVDLHRFCRYVIHHDLCWNPSTLEQRTGRIDRIGAKVEQCGQPIQVYLPYLAETQDEKLYRVVMDRERWFSVVMGEQLKTDARSTDNLAQRVPLPASLARELAFRLEADRGEAN